MLGRSRPGTPADASQNFSISLSAGWNAIGDPFFKPVPVSSLIVDGSTFAQASTGSTPLVSSTIWGYSGTANGGQGGYIAATSLTPNPDTGFTRTTTARSKSRMNDCRKYDNTAIDNSPAVDDRRGILFSEIL